MALKVEEVMRRILSDEEVVRRCIGKGMWAEGYHGIPRPGGSWVKALCKSPLAFKAAVEQTVQVTPPMVWGSEFHRQLLEPEVARECLVMAYPDQRTKKGQAELLEAIMQARSDLGMVDSSDTGEQEAEAWRRELIDWRAGRGPCPWPAGILSSEEEADIRATVEATLGHGDANVQELCMAIKSCEVPLLSAVPLALEGPFVAGKGKLDGLGVLRKSGRLVVVDVKTHVDISPDAIQRTVINQQHDVQAAWYMDLLDMLPDVDIQAVLGDGVEVNRAEPAWYCLLAIQKPAAGVPSDAAVYVLGDEWLDRGREKYREAWGVLLKGLECGEIPGVSGRSDYHLHLPVPKWARRTNKESIHA